MSIFNFRRGRPAKTSAKASAGSSPPSESVEVVRKRARQRLIGSAVLVLAGVIGFPLLFETQPRPVPVDIAIEIPSRSAIKPGSPIPAVTRQDPVLPAESVPEPEPAKAVAAEPVPPAQPSAPPVSAQASLIEKEEILTPPRVPAKPETKAEAKPEAKAEAKATARPKSDDGQRARALLEGAAPAASGDLRLVVQVGAFADEALAREARIKLERAGLKTYTQVADTKDGKRIRVRVGPYASKAEAEKAASKIKTLNLPAAVLTL